MYKLNDMCRVSLEALHTHTHTHTCSFTEQIGAIGGSREYERVTLFPRDLK